MRLRCTAGLRFEGLALCGALRDPTWGYIHTRADSAALEAPDFYTHRYRHMHFLYTCACVETYAYIEKESSYQGRTLRSREKRVVPVLWDVA